MTDKKNEKKDDPVLKDVEPGSDADEMPIADVGETPPDPNTEPSDN